MENQRSPGAVERHFCRALVGMHRSQGTIQTDVMGYVARMKRSVIRERGAPIFPDSVALHPGYHTAAPW